MKPLSDQDHYEVLEVPRGATLEEIERAYRVAQATYAEDSMALYSVFGGEDASALRQRIELAWSVLSDVTRRRAYDELLATGAAPATAPSLPRVFDGERGFLRTSSSLPEPEPAPRAAGPVPVDPRPLPHAVLEPLESTLEGDPVELDGSALREVRARRGVSLDQIARVTKINPTYLRFLEEDRFDDLPAPVYVRGFLTAYLRCCGIDPATAVPPYMARFEAARAASSQKKGRFAARS